LPAGLLAVQPGTAGTGGYAQRTAAPAAPLRHADEL
jgi:hypothetical protein